MSIQRHQHQGGDGFDRSEFHKDRDGHWVIGLRPLSRMAGVSTEAVSKALKGVNLKPSKLAKALLAQGFCPGNLEAWSETGVPERAVPVILSYYAFDAQKTSALARQVLMALTAVGIHAYLDEVLGEGQKVLEPSERVRQRVKATELDKALNGACVAVSDKRKAGAKSDMISTAKGVLICSVWGKSKQTLFREHGLPEGEALQSVASDDCMAVQNYATAQLTARMELMAAVAVSKGIKVTNVAAFAVDAAKDVGSTMPGEVRRLGANVGIRWTPKGRRLNWEPNPEKKALRPAQARKEIQKAGQIELLL